MHLEQHAQNGTNQKSIGIKEIYNPSIKLVINAKEPFCQGHISLSFRLEQYLSVWIARLRDLLQHKILKFNHGNIESLASGKNFS